MTDSDAQTSWTTPFGEEMDARNAHLDALPGRAYRDWFESLNRASMVLSGNSAQIENHLGQFVHTPMFVSELPDDFAAEAARLLHNYLAAIATLRDVQRVIHRKIWPDRRDPGDKQTIWETTVWAPKIQELFDDPPVVFLIDLRNYSMHYAIPQMSMSTSWGSITGQPGGPSAMRNTVAVDPDVLLNWDGWRSKGRQFVESHQGGSIDIVEVIALYSTRVREFFGWFWQQIEDSNRIEILEYRYKAMEWGHYLDVESMVTQFGPDGRSVVRPRLAEARLRRAAFGTRGWRLFTLNSEGEWIAGARDPGWPPLAEGPR
ncbi:hypothetical protein [Mycobacterium sp. SMC-17]|uniref:hypothetical protein n=1 Tax=Mycobacterium sp. SMC-17 TaxID=3381628 RepID=UPI0038768865